MDTILIQVRFSVGNYSDALYYTLDEWPSVTPERMETDKQARYDTWAAMVAELSNQVTAEDEQQQEN
ncbi:hypothetical protein [Paludibaculum fermentans]|uniref:hypothetical protein n=1 Tax=Paludibaculum fermentans TaxID=1473598 RepID=UPI003EB9BAAA